MSNTKTAEEIMVKVANEHSYESWGELMYDTHEHSQIEYTKQAMEEYANQFKTTSLERDTKQLIIKAVDDTIDAYHH